MLADAVRFGPRRRSVPFDAEQKVRGDENRLQREPDRVVKRPALLTRVEGEPQVRLDLLRGYGPAERAPRERGYDFPLAAGLVIAVEVAADENLAPALRIRPGRSAKGSDHFKPFDGDGIGGVEIIGRTFVLERRDEPLLILGSATGGLRSGRTLPPRYGGGRRRRGWIEASEFGGQSLELIQKRGGDPVLAASYFRRHFEIGSILADFQHVFGMDNLPSIQVASLTGADPGGRAPPTRTRNV